MIELQADMNITEGLSAELGDNLQLNAQLNDVFVAGVTSWNGQTGDVTYTPPTVPTKTSQLQNDSGFVTSADVPSKTSDLVNDSGFLTSAVTSFNGQTGAVTYTAPVTSVNGQTGSVTVTVPTQTSQLQNDSGYITSAGAPVQSVNGQTGAVVTPTYSLDKHTDTVIGTDATFTVTQPTITVTPNTTTVPNVTAAGSASSWAFTVTSDGGLVVTGTNGTAPTLGAAITVVDGITSASASGGNVAWNNKDSVAVLTSDTEIVG